MAGTGMQSDQPKRREFITLLAGVAARGAVICCIA
jgi:hypothetical protein